MIYITGEPAALIDWGRESVFNQGVQQLTDTHNLNMPINCVMEGQQQPNKKAMALKGIPRAMRKLFGE